MLNGRNLIILRGVSGSGKSTLAAELQYAFWCADQTCSVFEADSYFYSNGEYKFNAKELQKAHDWCLGCVDVAMKFKDTNNIILSNTSTSEKEIAPYLALAESYGYTVVSLVVENRHGNSSVHDVPQKTLERQARKIKDSLKLL